MYKPYQLLVALSLLFGLTTPSISQKQKNAYLLGKSKDFLNQLNRNFSISARNSDQPDIKLEVSSEKYFTGRINYHEISSGGRYIIGSLENEEQSDFFIKVTEWYIEGNMVLKSSGRAFSYYSDSTGNAYVKEVDIDQVLCINYEHYSAKAPANSAGLTNALAGNVTDLESLPGANGCVLLDFDGEYVAGTPWNSGNPINAEPSGMSNEAISQVWELVSEDFRPFNLNITTSLAVFNSYPKNRRMRCIVSPTNTAAPGSGGVAYVNSFTYNNDTPCWVFITSSAKSCGEAVSHEIGHTLGLHHDGRTSPEEGYFTGHGNWAPIMGVGYYKEVTQWSKGEYAFANNKEDDLAIIANSVNGLGYRQDDHGNSGSNATAILVEPNSNVLAAKNSGIIEKSSDVDMFLFNTSGGVCSLNFSPAGQFGNLDLRVKLYSSSGSEIGSYNPAGLGASFSVNLNAGTYYIAVFGTGAGDPLTNGYSNYASIGRYSISGIIPVPANQLPLVSITSPSDNSGYSDPATVSISASASDPDGAITKIEFYNSSEKLGEDLTPPYTFTWSGVSAGTYYLSAVATDNSGGATVSKVVTITVGNTAQPPVVSITSPQTNTQLAAPADILITASASDPDGVITKVKFYNGSQLLGEDVTAPYSFSLQGASPGTYYFSAVANDNSGMGTVSEVVTVNVVSENQPPSLSLSLPTGNSGYTAPANIVIEAFAGDNDGSVTKVEFFNGTEKISEDFTPPFSCSWNNVTAGNYSVFATATDDQGASATSPVINLAVLDGVAVSYCASNANSTQYEYIDFVAIGATENTSGNNSGYGDFSELNAMVSHGETFSVRFRRGFSGNVYPENWRVWMDYNQDGDFLDAQEMVAEGSTTDTGTFYSGITIPQSALIGKTKIRIAMKYGSMPGPCEVFSFGEVEDYSVEVLSPAIAFTDNFRAGGAVALGATNELSEQHLSIRPNPAKESVVLTVPGFEGEGEGEIVDMNGMVIKKFDLSGREMFLNLKGISPGVYLIQIKSGRENFSKRLIKVD